MNSDIKIIHPTRSCRVGDRVGKFHIWEQYSKLVEASPMIGGAPAGCISQVFGIVEFASGVERVDPYKIIFEDEDHAMIESYQKYRDEKEKRND